MAAMRGDAHLHYRHLGRAELDIITTLDLDPVDLERFLGPVADIVTAARRGLAHAAVAIEALGACVGFYVIHPAPADSACWWLGWFAVDRRQRGKGYGASAMATILKHLRSIPGCRRVKLLVAPDNLRALSLYRRAGFRRATPGLVGDELVLERVLPSHVALAVQRAFVVFAAAVKARRVFFHVRLRLIVGPHPAWVIGVERGPPEGAPLGLAC